ncbi:hypothetical protein [Estrella lausannensis]|uniref:Uncharacterized protein n=1 Tax=Estrella lausannensis TaxID=483423 RepID=A0A0H5DQ38_9BACT|nr:hypothetical protein [Estrella lausannensis]CRX38597.1 hypothetical protein ELAC_1256 [Estrella lausannensis]
MKRTESALLSTRRCHLILALVMLFTCQACLFSQDYVRNPYVEESVWESLKPYFIPSDHPVKKKLDALFFKNERVTASNASLIQAGFQANEVQGIRVFVVKHLEIPGFVFKILTDDQDSRPDASSWLSRVQGAEKIQSAIVKYGYQKYFKVPRKWIYPLPAEPSPQEIRVGGRKNFILIAEDVKPYPREKNLKKWGELKDKKLLDALCRVVLTTGAADSIKENNIPWCQDGLIAFVDTEHTGDPDKIRWYRLGKILNKKMKDYWTKITFPYIQSNG